MMQKQTLLNRIEIEPHTGRVFVRLMKANNEPHRFSIEPQARMAHLKTAAEHLKHVNNHLVSMGFSEMQKEDMKKILDVARTHAIKDYVPPSSLLEQLAPKTKRRK
jgi:hypothetical protein